MSLLIGTYLSHDVFGPEPNRENDAERNLVRPNQVFRPSSIGMGYPWDTQDQARHELSHEYLLTDKDEISDLIDFFDGKFGMWDHFWCPSWCQDLTVTAAVGAADASLTIEDVDYDTYWLPNDVTGRHIVLVYPDGTQVYRKVLDAPAPTSLTLDSAVGKACAAADLWGLLVCFLYFVRFNVDELSLEYLSDTLATAKLYFREVPEEG